MARASVCLNEVVTKPQCGLPDRVTLDVVWLAASNPK